MVAGFSLCLFTVGGCGHGGNVSPASLPDPDKPEPTPPAPIINYKVVFKYESLAKALGRTKVDSNIASVRYAFAKDENYIGVATETYIFDHERQNKDQDIICEDVNSQVNSVTAAYYDTNNKLIAVGINEIDWQDGETCIIEDPELVPLSENDHYLFNYDKDKLFGKGSELDFTLTVIPVVNNKSYNITPFAEFDGLNDKQDPNKEVLSPIDGNYNGDFIAKDYGVIKPSLSIGSDLEFTVEEDIYITDQALDSISLLPADKTITVKDKSFTIAYVDTSEEWQKDYDFGKKTVDMLVKGEDHVWAVNKLPLQVVLNYSNDPDKGPQPDSIDITDKATISIDNSTLTGLQLEDNTLIASGAASDLDVYTVKAKYNELNFDTESTVHIAPVETHVAFALESTSKPGELEYATDGYSLDDYFSQTGKNSVDIFLVGRMNYSADPEICSKPFYIDESLIAPNAYPESCVHGWNTWPNYFSYSRAEDGSNRYSFILKTTLSEVPNTTWKLSFAMTSVVFPSSNLLYFKGKRDYTTGN